VVELLVGMLFADRTVSLAAADTPSPEGFRFLTAGEIAEIVRRIEEVSLDGIEVDRLVERMAATLDTLQKPGSPDPAIPPPRAPGKEPGGDPSSPGADPGAPGCDRRFDRGRQEREASRFLKDVGLFLNELDAIRAMAGETREFTKQYFDILRKKEQVEGAGDSIRQVMRETIAYSDGRVTALLPVVRTLEERERAAAWERRKPELLTLRSVVGRQLADALIGQARRLRLEPGEPARGESLAALRRAVSLLTGDRPRAGGRVRCGRRDRLRSFRG